MGQSRETVREVSLDATGGAADSAKCWDAPCIIPFRNITIWVSSRGEEWAAGDLEWEVFYTYRWSSGSPFQSGSVPGDGISQGSGAIAGGTQVLERVHNDTNLLPANMRANPTKPSSSLDKTGFAGAAIVCELTNKKAVPITVFVSFLSETVNDII